MTVLTKERTKKEMEPRQKQEITGAEATRPGPIFTPAVDIFETESSITLLADMPGVLADGLGIDLKDNVLIIDGRVEPQASGGERRLLQEYETGSFRREFRLSNMIDQERIDASLSDGVLRLTLPKAEAARPRKIEVRAG
ncbi:MAG: Hsp20 family protein [Acidobacteria bacterium]|nr:Hsp20 family protein [Acidobacteriota bacterium]NIM61241.1 Hsp20 family protein [Acidobacteriota bacterium]NIO58046.1 Hsp20 family protein [Acidobacteriota bacterium]NIQ29057.1 Hsp20 family protein [Acidobacteriota bacterium]NIQ83585.1 Hsp20 family protein [Acidobacteriota bacterium]